jgi:folate-dependent tRNA-U54 methylase TrmFO/GidA
MSKKGIEFNDGSITRDTVNKAVDAAFENKEYDFDDDSYVINFYMSEEQMKEFNEVISQKSEEYTTNFHSENYTL